MPRERSAPPGHLRTELSRTYRRLIIRARASLRGELGLYFSRDGGRLGLLRLALRALLGRIAQERDFHSFAVAEVEIATRRRLLRIAVDGELTVMPPPVVCRSRPRALRVLAPVPEPVPPPA